MRNLITAIILSTGVGVCTSPMTRSVYIEANYNDAQGGVAPTNGEFILDNMTESMETIRAEMDADGNTYITTFPSSIEGDIQTINYDFKVQDGKIGFNIPNIDKITKYNSLGQVIFEGKENIAPIGKGIEFYKITNKDGKDYVLRVIDGKGFKRGNNWNGKVVVPKENKEKGTINRWRLITAPYSTGNFEPDTSFHDIDMDVSLH